MTLANEIKGHWSRSLACAGGLEFEGTAPQPSVAANVRGGTYLAFGGLNRRAPDRLDFFADWTEVNPPTKSVRAVVTPKHARSKFAHWCRWLVVGVRGVWF